MRKSSLIVGIVVAVLVIGGVAYAVGANKNKNNSSSGTQPSTSTPSQSSSDTSNSSQSDSTGSINIRDMMFTPSQITVAKGGTVTWTNNDTTAHTVTDDLSNVGGPDSGDIAPGETYSFKFEKAGSFQYHCKIHTSMRGTIVVK